MTVDYFFGKSCHTEHLSHINFFCLFLSVKFFVFVFLFCRLKTSMLQPMSLDSSGHSPLKNVSGGLGCEFKIHQVKVVVHATTQEELVIFVLYPKGLV